MASASDVEKVWKLMEKIGFCMLATHDDEDSECGDARRRHAR